MTGRWEGKRDGSHKFMCTSKTHGFGESGVEEPEAGGAPTAAAAAAAAAGTGVCARGGPGVIDAPVTTAEAEAGEPPAAAAGGDGSEGEDVLETTATLDDDLSGTDDGEGRGGVVSHNLSQVTLGRQNSRLRRARRWR